LTRPEFDVGVTDGVPEERTLNVGPPLLELVGVGRTFPGVVALRDVSVDFHAGEVHALVGENGAGKSTLINLLCGVLQPTSGALRMDGRALHLSDPVAARRLGIVAVHQESELFPTLSIAENLALSQGLPTGPLGWVRWREVDRDAAAAVAVLHESLDARQAASGLRVAQRQMLQVAHAVARKARFVILDEPTSSLSGAESEWLFAQIRGLRARGVGVLYVSHRQEEIFALADRVTVLRDGRLVWTKPRSEVDRPALVAAMVGRDYALRAPDAAGPIGAEVLAVESLADVDGRFRNVSLRVHAGEVVGLYGLIGAGRTEFAQALFGLRPCRGVVRLFGRPYQPTSPTAAVNAGVAYLPEDRLTEGVFRGQSLRFNAVLASLRRWSLGPFLKPRAESAGARRVTEECDVKHRELGQPIGELSGGNQQKVVLGRWMLAQPTLLLLDEPTRGVDVRAKAELHALIRKSAADGAAVVLISSELEEAVAHADRVVVFRGGEVAAEFAAAPENAVAIAEAALPHGDRAATTRRSRGPSPSLPAAELTLGSAVVALTASLALTSDAFLTPDNLTSVVEDACLWLMLALAAATVIVAGAIDISIGSIFALAAGVAAVVLKSGLSPAVAAPLAVVAGVGTGALASALNAGVTIAARVHPIVVTLGMLTLYRGLLRFLFSFGGWTILSDLPSGFRWLALGRFGGIGVAVWIAVAAAIACHLWWTRLASGRRLFALGGSATAARLVGVSKARTWLAAFTVAGALAGAAGFIALARNGSIQATFGQGYELRAITAAVIGGVAVTGGRGSVAGVALGSLLLSLIQNALILWRVPPIYYDLATGGLLLAAVLLDVAARRRRT
jgi:rhamnose transport system ATP-binding protein